MAGNERQVAEYLFKNIGTITLSHLGVIRMIGIPLRKSILQMKTKGDISRLSTQNSSKKADIYINGKGVSVKQSGSCFLFNRLQRAGILNVFNMLGFTYSNNLLATFDKIVDNFHYERVANRSRPWDEIFEEDHFRMLLKFLMMDGSPNNGLSANPAELILEAPYEGINSRNIQVFTFDEYFHIFKDKFKIDIRRSWIGQGSNGEHRRATGLAKKVDNLKWVYEEVRGMPLPSRSSGKIWRDDVAPSARRTVYYICIEKS